MAQSMGKLYVEIAGNASKLVNEVGKVNKSLGTLELAAKRLQSNLIGMFGAYSVIHTIQGAITTLAEFDKTMTAVQAITKASGKDFEELNKSALKLGSSTQYTAKQVAELQLEFGRLGFSTKEILDATKATVDLATATGEGLARSAEIAGSTLRAFQMDSSEMGRVVDIMASSLNESALTLDTFADAIKYVAPVAKATGVTLEETAAMMSVLADAGIKGSQSGTSMRRIMTMLTKDGKPLADRLQELSDKGLTLAGANDEVGLYAQTALLHLTALLPRVKELTVAYGNNQGEASTTARIMENNLATSLLKVKSAYDGFILSMINSKGILMETANSIADFFRELSGGDAKKLVKFHELLGDIQSQIRHDFKGRATEGVLKDLAKQARELGIELTVLRDAEGYLSGVEKLTRSNAMGPAPLSKNLELIKIIAEYNNKITEDKIKQGFLDEEAKKAYQEKIKLANDLGDAENRRLLQSSAIKAFNDSAAARSSGLLSSTQAGNFNVPPPSEEARTLWEIAIEQQERFGEAAKKAREELFGSNKEKIQQQVELIHFWGDAISNVIDNVIAKDQDFARSAAETTARIIDATKNEIAAYIAKAAAKALALNPTPAGIATASAIIGIGLSLVSGVLKRFAKTSDVNTRATGSSASSAATQSGNIQGSVVIRGQDLYVAMNNYSYNNRYTKAGG